MEFRAYAMRTTLFYWQERTSGKEATGDEHEVSGRNLEIEGESGEKPCGQCICNPKF